ncbi:glycosyltransferase family 39 protein [Kitasatospora sp. NPDC002227]|uniref:glycosyltransferase family 39 protein n=1 Tax=Kitasatospora sp. NPDC002227 TaxID=3154773 RepID=UPI003328D0B4
MVRARVAGPPFLLSLVLGLWGITRQGSIWRDEVVTVQVAHRSLPELWRLLGGIDAVHGLYYLLLHGVFALWDGGLVALRLPSVLATALAAALLADLGRRLAGAAAGLAAGLVFALLPAIQQYAQEGRSYALVTAAVVLAGWQLVRARQRPGGWAWAGYGLAVLLGGLLHEFAVLAVAAHGVSMLWARAGRRVLLGWALAVAGAAAGLAPLAVLSGRQADQVGWITTPGLADVWAPALTSAVGALCWWLLGRGPAAALAVVGLPWLVVPPAVLILVSYLDPLYVDRYVVFSYAGLALLVGGVLARGLQALPGRARRVVAVLAVPAAVAALLPVELGLRAPGARPNDVAAAARAVQELARPGDAVLFLPGARREAALYDPAAFAGLHDLALAEAGADSGTINGVEAEPAAITAALRGATGVVLVTDPRPRPAPNARDRAKAAALAKSFAPCRAVLVRGLKVVRYARPGECPAGAAGG